MKRFLLSFGLIVAAGTAVAGPDCSDIAHETPMWTIVKDFEDTGGTIKVAKVTSGNCYEIYGIKGNEKLEIYFNPKTGAEISRNTK